jgi:hypothetical protein
MPVTTRWAPSLCKPTNPLQINAAQYNCTTIKKELLSVVEVLREFCTMLYGTDLSIHTDHKNLTYSNLNTQRVLRWRLLIEEYGPTYEYVKEKTITLPTS